MQQQILFLRDFAASRLIKGRFILRSRTGGEGQGQGHGAGAGEGQGTHGRAEEQRFAFDHRPHHFARGETARVRHITRPNAASLLVITDNPVLGEVVLDGAQEGHDYEVLP